jgi:hypothetical protein
MAAGRGVPAASELGYDRGGGSAAAAALPWRRAVSLPERPAEAGGEGCFGQAAHANTALWIPFRAMRQCWWLASAMSSGRKGNSYALGGNTFAQAAAAAVNQIINGPHADKRTARRLNCSLRMAKYLRAGKGWTVERLSFASAILGDRFDRLLMPHLHTIERVPPPTDFDDRLDRVLKEISAVRDEINSLKTKLGGS